MDEIGKALAQLRGNKEMSQEVLAKKAGISQATISRIEKQEQVATVKTLAKLARALDVALTDLAPPSTLAADDYSSPESFHGFCDNPFCSRNELKKDKTKGATVYWKSWQKYSIVEYSEINFCKACGSDLVKECANCEKRLTETGARFCTRCGKKLTERPTDNDWKLIETRLADAPVEPEGEFDDDIPF